MLQTSGFYNRWWPLAFGVRGLGLSDFGLRVLDVCGCWVLSFGGVGIGGFGLWCPVELKVGTFDIGLRGSEKVGLRQTTGRQAGRQKDRRTCRHPHAPAHTGTHACTHQHTRIHAHAHTHTDRYTHTHTPTQTHTHTHARARTHTHTHRHLLPVWLQGLRLRDLGWRHCSSKPVVCRLSIEVSFLYYFVSSFRVRILTVKLANQKKRKNYNAD